MKKLLRPSIRHTASLAGGLIKILSVFVAVMAPARAVDITASFNDGNSAALADGYTGTTGGGWVSGWKATANNSYFANSVISSVPLSGGGNYLSATLNYNGTTTTGFGAIGRKFDPLVVSSTTAHSLRFK